MNDRAQGGSADITDKANIELMQNRRIMEDDNKGVSEKLDEIDPETGRGIIVTAKYWMQIFDYTKSHSKQREEQILIDQPLEYLFAFKYDKASEPVQTQLTQVKYLLNETNDYVTYHTFPEGKNKILVRFENIADRLDSDTAVQQLDVNLFAKTFYESANPGSQSSFTIKEMSLTNNQLQSDLDARKSQDQWIGDDDDKMVFVQKPVDKDGKYALEPSRIRTFAIEYTPELE